MTTDSEVLTLIEHGTELPTIEDRTGWDPDDISGGLAVDNGYVFDLGTFRFYDRAATTPPPPSAGAAVTRAPGSTVARMVANAMNIMNIEVETGWTRDEIIELAVEQGFGLNAANGRFQKAPRPKPAPVGIVRTAPLATGGIVDRQVVREPEPPALTVPLTKTSTGAVSEPHRQDVATPAPVLPAPTPDPFDAAGAAFAQLLRTIAAALGTPAIPAVVAHVPKTPKPNGGSTPRLTAGATQSEIRAWAYSQGLDVNPRGSVRRDIADAYAADHQETP